MKIVNNKVVIEDNSYLVMYRHVDWEVYPEKVFSSSELKRGWTDSGSTILLVYYD